MEAKIFSQSRNLPLTLPCRKYKYKAGPRVIGMLARTANDIKEETEKADVCTDNWFDRLAINHLSKSVQAATGLYNSKSGYGSLVEAARAASQNFNQNQQQQVVIQALDKAFPRPILSLIRTLLPPSKFAREYFAAFTTVFFAWLVGPCEVIDSEVNGRREKNIVHIKKCRFLEETNCVGMCVNLCKMPSQAFIKDSLGMPVSMVPNASKMACIMYSPKALKLPHNEDFDDMSCDMVFGQDPPASTDDPALKKPCYALCNNVISSLHIHARPKKGMEWTASVKQRVGMDGTRVPPTFYVLPKITLIYHHFSVITRMTRCSIPLRTNKSSLASGFHS